MISIVSSLAISTVLEHLKNLPGKTYSQPVSSLLFIPFVSLCLLGLLPFPQRENFYGRSHGRQKIITEDDQNPPGARLSCTIGEEVIVNSLRSCHM